MTTTNTGDFATHFRNDEPETAPENFYGTMRPSSHRPTPAAVSGGVVEQLLLEDAARDLATQIAAIQTSGEWRDWWRIHSRIVAGVWSVVPESPSRRKLASVGRRAQRRFGQPT